MDHEPRSGVREEKSARDRLMRLAESHPEWVLGFEDEVWWSRFEQPGLHAWAPEGEPMRLVSRVERPVAKREKGKKGEGGGVEEEAKALACYGLYLHLRGEDGSLEKRVWLRFVEGRPVSELTCRYLEWCCGELKALGKTALLLVWDNAGWHTSRMVRGWIDEHNRKVKEEGKGVRILPCLLPKKSPWLNPIEPKWVHAKRRVVEPDGPLNARELADRACAALGCAHEDHLAIPENAA